MLYIDLDNFKDVNDSLGHDIGDLLLKEVARRLESVARESDFIARLSGDEFCILVEDVVDNFAAANLAQRSLEAVSQPFENSVRKLSPACSIGIAHYPDDGESIPALLKAADISLYAAKEHGRNRYAFYRPELTHRAEHRFQVEQYLREAIENRQLSLVYQPQVNVNTGEIIGVEALSRWHHPLLGQVPPADFINIAERIGMIKPLTEWVLNTACRQAVAWRKAGFPGIRMAVNISPSHFVDRDIVRLIKIDKYFFDDILIDKETPLLVGSMIDMGHYLGYEVIAEGIETSAQLGMIEKLGCETAQNFLFSKPVSADGIAKLFCNTFAVKRRM